MTIEKLIVWEAGHKFNMLTIYGRQVTNDIKFNMLTPLIIITLGKCFDHHTGHNLFDNNDGLGVLLAGNPKVGNLWSINHQDCLN